jgi:hypothetical protein
MSSFYSPKLNILKDWQLEIEKHEITQKSKHVFLFFITPYRLQKAQSLQQIPTMAIKPKN